MRQCLKKGVIVLVKAIAWSLLGLRIKHRERLPIEGPGILVANHNSHLDALVLMALYPLAMAAVLRPVASERYFLEQNRFLAWFADYVLDIIPVSAKSAGGHCQHRTFLIRCDEALAHKQILIVFPEGSRGQPECLSAFQSGIAHLAKRHPTVPIVPIFLHGLGKAMPKDDPLFVPFVCGVAIGPPLFWQGDKRSFLARLTAQIQGLSSSHLGVIEKPSPQERKNEGHPL